MLNTDTGDVSKQSTIPRPSFAEATSYTAEFTNAALWAWDAPTSSLIATTVVAPVGAAAEAEAAVVATADADTCARRGNGCRVESDTVSPVTSCRR